MTSTRRDDRWDAVVVLGVILLGASVLFGGASRDNALRLALVELVGTPLLLIAGWRMVESGEWRDHKLPLAILASVVAIPLVQLCPLHFDLWRNLPGREPFASTLVNAGVRPAWLPLSMAAEETWRAVLALIPPAAMFLCALTVSPETRRRMAGAYLIAVVASLLLSAWQLAGSSESPFYPYARTNYGSAVGFFANRNHLGAFLVASLPLAGVFIGQTLSQGRRGNGPRLMLASIYYLTVLVGIAVVRSRAGVILAGPALVGSLIIVWRTSRSRRATPAVLGVAGGAALGLIAIALFALDPILARFDPQAAPEGRFETWPIIAEAADAYLPLGAGVGSFDPIYRTVEPLESVSAFYLNHAHNDFLEIWLETGWLGAAALAAFAVWYVGRSIRAWRTSGGSLARAASASILLLLLHSIVDYPLRTETLAVFFAFLCACLECAQRRSSAPES